MEIKLEGVLVNFTPFFYYETKFKLVVKDSGSYTADSFTELIWIVLRHRLQHLCKGEGWRD